MKTLIIENSKGEEIEPAAEGFVKAARNQVDNPQHYNHSDIECIDAIEAMLEPEEFLGYLRGTVLKYLWRCKYKGKTIEDLEKSDWYSKRLVDKLRNKEAETLEEMSKYVGGTG